MAVTPFISSSQAAIHIIAEGTDTALRASQSLVAVVGNFTSPQIYASQTYVTVVTDRVAPTVDVSQVMVMVVAIGRGENPKLRAWTYSLDGHDYYVLRLGDFLTLVFDVYSEQWMDWADFLSLTWRAQFGMNWFGGTALADTYGSNVIAGDDTLGLLWFLDPDQPYDENPDEEAEDQEIYFERITMGQMAMNGREVLPCYAMWLTTDMGAPAYEGAGVQLEISDDAGKSFDDMGIVTVTLDNNTPELSWYSLGQISAPGRLFRITDDGAVTRIDAMEMNDPDDEK